MRITRETKGSRGVWGRSPNVSFQSSPRDSPYGFLGDYQPGQERKSPSSCRRICPRNGETQGWGRSSLMVLGKRSFPLSRARPRWWRNFPRTFSERAQTGTRKLSGEPAVTAVTGSSRRRFFPGAERAVGTRELRPGNTSPFGRESSRCPGASGQRCPLERFPPGFRAQPARC